MCTKKLWLLVFSWNLISIGSAQVLKPLYIITIHSDSSFIGHRNVVEHLTFKDKIQVYDFILPSIDSMHLLGYLECHMDSIEENDSSFIVTQTIGKLYSYTGFDYSKVPESIVDASGFKRYVMNKPRMNPLQCREALKKISLFLDKQNYPYAQVYLDSSVVQNGTLISRLNLLLGPRIFIDSIEWDDQLRVSKALMDRLVGLKSGNYFSNTAMEEMQNQLATQKFLEIYNPPQVVLYENKAIVKLFIRDKKVSSVDALLGLLPGNTENPGLKLNGTFNGYFVNQFRQGESLLVNFQSLQNNSQSLKLDLGIPYFLKLPFSPFAHFNLYKRDSLFLDVKAEVGAEWRLGKQGRFKTMVGSISSSLLKPDLERIKMSKMLPQALDLNYTYLGADIQIKKLDIEINPRSGYAIQAMINGSSRMITTNPAILSLQYENDTSFSFASLYDGMLKKGYSVECGIQASLYIPVRSFSTWFNSIHYNFKNASGGLKLNELYRIGGYQLMRGFDEQSILASDYLIWINEYRLITGARSYLHVHSDLGSIRALKTDQYQRSTYWSLGAGIVFDTSLGLLSVSSSIGRKFPDSFDLRAVKLHVGYINYF